MSAQSEAVVRSLGLLFTEGTHCGLADGELLERFVSRGDGGAAHAFEGLVLRHGPMVFDVCRRVLGDPHDAEDAFQATFLVLAARARSIRRRKSVGSWLHGVALRVARRARVDAARRRAHERRAAEMNGRDVASGPPGDDSDFRALHEEVERLPRKYREPIVLCYLEGLTLEAAAGQLGCPVGTVGVRLMRAKQRLKERLGCRGVSRADGPLIAGPGPSALPASLVHSTVGAACRLAAVGAGPMVSTLADGVLRSMATVRLAQVVAISAAVILGAASVGGALGLAAPQLAEGPASRGPESWIGKKVVTKYSEQITDGGRIADPDGRFRIFSVARVEGQRLWLVCGEVAGWIEARQALLLDRAIDFYSEEIRKDPGKAEAYYQRALIWSEGKKQAERAILDCTEAIRLEPRTHWRAYHLRGGLLAARGDLDGAIADYTTAIRIQPDLAALHYCRGALWERKSDHHKAIADLTEALRLDPMMAVAYGDRGGAWLQLGEYEKAIADLDEAIRLNPNCAEAYANRGEAQDARRRYDRAIADHTEAIRLTPGIPLRYYQRGHAYQSKGDHIKAIADFDQAIRLDPKEATTYFARGVSRGQLREFDGALDDFNRALELDPRFADAWAGRAWIWQAEGEYGKAISEFDEALRLDPGNAYAHRRRAEVLMMEKDYDRAIIDFDEAIRRNPRERATHLYRGLAGLRKKDYDGAIADFDEVLLLDPDQLAEVDPKGVSARLNRGWAWSRKRDYARAVADYEEASRIDPRNPGVAYPRAWLSATCPDARFRDGERAIEMAESLCKSYEWKVPHYVATLAAACAETGDFDAAVKWQTRANAIEPDEVKRAEGEARLERFRAKTPYRDDRP